jgi:hypothetical protein
VNPLIAKLIIIDTIVNTRGCNWSAIKAAVLAHGHQPEDWLSEVRGPLQMLINEKMVCRAQTEQECYVLCAEFMV